MKRVLIITAVGVAMLVVGFFSGRAIQHAKTGYHYKVLEQKEYASPLGPIQWSCVSESVGLPFLDTGTTIIKLGNRTIYKAQRDFQEDAPYARNIEASGNTIAWEDGDFRYHLTVDRMTNDQHSPANRSQPIRSETNTTPSAAGSRR